MERWDEEVLSNGHPGHTGRILLSRLAEDTGGTTVLQHTGIPAECSARYLSKGELVLETSLGRRTYEVNTMYDEGLKLTMTSSTDKVGFADVVALVVVAKEVAAVEAAANCAIRAVEEWLSVAGLELASHKTEAVLISSRKAVQSAHIQIEGTTISSQRAIRYLGVMLDTRLSYRSRTDVGSSRPLSSRSCCTLLQCGPMPRLLAATCEGSTRRTTCVPSE